MSPLSFVLAPVVKCYPCAAKYSILIQKKLNHRKRRVPKQTWAKDRSEPRRRSSLTKKRALCLIYTYVPNHHLDGESPTQSRADGVCRIDGIRTVRSSAIDISRHPDSFYDALFPIRRETTLTPMRTAQSLLSARSRTMKWSRSNAWTGQEDKSRTMIPQSKQSQKMETMLARSEAIPLSSWGGC